MKQVSLVLSGGGIKGVAHLGLLAALQDYNITVSAISGTSAGALVGALYASGKSVDTILEFFKSYTIFQPFNFSLKKPGVFKSSRYKNILAANLPETFEELNIPLFICASNLNTGLPEYFSKGELILPTLASCAVPLLFTPVEYNGQSYTDGGVTDNFPVDPLMLNDNRQIWGSYVVKPYPSDDNAAFSSYTKLTIRTNGMVMFEGNKHKFVAMEQSFMPNMTKVSAFDTKQVDQAFNIGYAYARHKIEELDFS